MRGLAEQLTRLHAQKEALAETLLARVAALEAALAAPRPGPGARPPRRAAGGAREPAENPFAEISEQLTRLYAQKDATVETVFARLAPLEARLAELERRSTATRGARSTASPSGWRRCRAGVATLRDGAENPFAEISEQLTRLYAQKDATVETVFARLAPLEARLAALDPTGGARPLRRAAGGGAGPGGGAREAPRTRSPRSPSS